MSKQASLLGAAAAIALLAACNSGDEGTAGEAASGGKAGQLEPGRYEMTIKVLDMQMPDVQGMPANAEDLFRSTMESTNSFCLTPEQASESAFTQTSKQAQEQMGGDCTVEEDNNTPSKLDMTIACSPEGGTMRMTMTGDLTESGVRVVMDADGEVAGQRMAFKTEYKSRRVGDCEEEPAPAPTST